jgi:hypothetical protein
MEVYTFDQALIKKLIDTGYQHISLENGEGKKIVATNPEKKNFNKKIEEIKKRLNMLPDGLYQVKANWNYGGAGAPDIFVVKKGNAPIDNATINFQTTPLKENSRSVENVLSYEVALQNIQKIAQLEAQVRELSKENTRLQLDLEELEKEQSVAPLSENGFASSVTSWLKEITPVLLPLADRYFDTENRKLGIKEREQFLQHEGRKKPQVVRPGTSRKKQEQKSVYPDLNNEEQLNQFFDELEKLNEEQFAQACETIKLENPELFALVELEFSEEEQQEETTTQ